MVSHHMYETGARALAMGLFGWLMLRVACALWRGVCALTRMGVRVAITICALGAQPQLSGAMRWTAQRMHTWQQKVASPKSQASRASAAAHAARAHRDAHHLSAKSGPR